MMFSVRTTFNINDALLDELRNLSRRRKQSMNAIVEETLRRGLASGTVPRRPIRLTTHEVGIKLAYRGMSLNQLYDQLESEDHLRVTEP